MNKRIHVLLLLVLSVSLSAFGQQVRTLKAQLCGTVVLRDVDDKYNVVIYNTEMPEPDEGTDSELLEETKEKIARLFPHRRSGTARKTTSVDTPVIGTRFIADTSSGIPPDNYMAIGNDTGFTISVLNSIIDVHSPSTGAYKYRKALKVFSSVVGLNHITNDYRYDPKIIYDPEANKYICVMLNGTTGANYIVVAFSKTADPSGAWNFYKFYGNYANDNTWFDYPAVSINKQSFFLTGNKIIFDSSWQGGFTKTVIYQMDKAAGYIGDTGMDYKIWEGTSYAGRNMRCLHPVKPADTLLDNVQYFLSNRNFDIQNDTVFLVKLTGDVNSSTPLSIQPVISNIKYGVPPNGRQPDTTVELATNDGRVLGAFVKGNEIQFVSASVNPSSGASGVYHGIMNDINGTPNLTGDIIGIDTLDFGYPNISFAGRRAGSNHSIITFNYTGRKAYPGMAALFSDGTDHSNMVIVKRGDSSIKVLTGKDQRWGDYMGSQVRWNNIGEVWAEGIWGRRNKRYGSYMVQLYSPYYGIPEPPTDTVGPPNVYPNPAWTFVNFEFYLPADQQIHIAIYAMDGKLVDRLYDQYCYKGKNVLQFNTTVLPAARYMVRVTGANGNKIAVYNFIKL